MQVMYLILKINLIESIQKGHFMAFGGWGTAKPLSCGYYNLAVNNTLEYVLI